jgi:hypothetical protein
MGGCQRSRACLGVPVRGERRQAARRKGGGGSRPGVGRRPRRGVVWASRSRTAGPGDRSQTALGARSERCRAGFDAVKGGLVTRSGAGPAVRRRRRATSGRCRAALIIVGHDIVVTRAAVPPRFGAGPWEPGEREIGLPEPVTLAGMPSGAVPARLGTGAVGFGGARSASSRRPAAGLAPCSSPAFCRRPRSYRCRRAGCPGRMGSRSPADVPPGSDRPARGHHVTVLPDVASRCVRTGAQRLVARGTVADGDGVRPAAAAGSGLRYGPSRTPRPSARETAAREGSVRMRNGRGST